ncbi:carbohydrate kinase family protein [Croceiramulus getboli]|nr:carbohydrate kinase [Flavobacteriaceae bacterium YJPT1-3]
MSKRPHIITFGEILWDVFPDDKRLGGAPLNVALRLQERGANSAIISCLGDDELGKKALSAIEQYGLPIGLIQQHQRLPTGQVSVSLDAKGAASYLIEPKAAWDAIGLTPENQKEVAAADALLYGSLAFRESQNRTTLDGLLEQATYRILDLNLRPPHFKTDYLMDLMRRSDFVKWNEEELEQVAKWCALQETSVDDQLKKLAKTFELHACCVTLGADGALLFHEGKFYRHYGYPAKVVDTVGAGDSFLATLIYGLLSHGNPVEALDQACAMGALVAGKAGANATVSAEELKRLVGEPPKF